MQFRSGDNPLNVLPAYRPSSVMFASEFAFVMVVPLFQAPAVPARQAYSHWASVGRSNLSPVRCRSRDMNEPSPTASEAGHVCSSARRVEPFAPSRILHQETCSTGRVAQYVTLELKEGFVPITWYHCCCVVSKTPMQKSFVSVTVCCVSNWSASRPISLVRDPIV